ASRHHEKVSNAVFSELRTYGMLGSTLSERFARRAAELVGRILSRDVGNERIPKVFIVGIHMSDHGVFWWALGVDADGRKQVLGMRESTTENRAVCSAVLDDMVSKGLDAGQGILFVAFGGKNGASTVNAAFGEPALIQRCQIRKRKNMLEHLPDREERWVNEKLSLV
ncbi:MAG: transposase, partial [Thermoproteota archaeon]